MADIVEYSNSRESIEKRVDSIVDLIERLDRDSFKLFSEIMDLDSKSYYKVDNLLYRTNELYKVYEYVVKAYQYVYDVELSSYNYANKRHQLKRMLSMMVTLNVFLINAFLGIVSFIILNQKTTKDFVEEIKKIEKAEGKLENENINIIDTTLDNCSRILNGKIRRMDNDQNIISANNYISMYINGNISIEDVNAIPEDIKYIIVRILKSNTDTDSNDILELLNIEKEKRSENLKLIKEYKKS